MDKNLQKLYALQSKLEENTRKKKKRMKGTGFAKQKQMMEQVGYYVKGQQKKSVKLIDKRKK